MVFCQRLATAAPVERSSLDADKPTSKNSTTSLFMGGVSFDQAGTSRKIVSQSDRIIFLYLFSSNQHRGLIY